MGHQDPPFSHRSVFWGANRTCARSRSDVWMTLISLGWQTVVHLLMLSKHCFPSLAGCSGPHSPSGAAEAVCNCWLDLPTNPGSWHELPPDSVKLEPTWLYLKDQYFTDWGFNMVLWTEWLASFWNHNLGTIQWHFTSRLTLSHWTSEALLSMPKSHSCAVNNFL